MTMGGRHRRSTPGPTGSRRSAVVAAGMVIGLAGVLPAWVYETSEHLPAQAAVSTRPAGGQPGPARSMQAFPQAIPVLTYHDISTSTSSYAITPEAFDRQLQALADAGFTSVSLQQLNQVVRGSQPVPPLPERPLLITFDDGFASTWLNADPILAKHGYRAVAFVITGSIKPGYAAGQYLNEAEITQMASSGRWEFGSHTDKLHFRVRARGADLPALTARWQTSDGTLEPIEAWRARVHSDLSASATVLQRLTGSAPAAFAFPYGSLDGANNDPRIPAQLTEQLADEGFVTAFLSGDATLDWSPRRTPAEPGDQPWSIPRIGMVASTSVDQMLDLLSGMAPVPVGIPADEQMVADGGTCTHLGGAVRLSVGGGYASCRSMRNTWSWRNYVVDADLSAVPSGCSVGISVHDANRAGRRSRTEAWIGSSQVVLRDVVGATVTVLARTALPAGGARSHLRIETTGTQVHLVLGQTELTATSGATLHGGVAYSAACPSSDATVLLRHVIAAPLSNSSFPGAQT